MGDTMRASIDGNPVAFLQSPGIAHATKSILDDLKIWDAEAVK